MPGRLVATIDTEIVGRRYHPCAVEPGDVLRLRREPENPHDANAVRVETRDGRQAGYLPRRFARWFAAWLDGGAIATAVLVPFHAPEDARWATPALIVVWAAPNVKLFGFPRPLPRRAEGFLPPCRFDAASPLASDPPRIPQDPGDAMGFFAEKWEETSRRLAPELPLPVRRYE